MNSGLTWNVVLWFFIIDPAKTNPCLSWRPAAVRLPALMSCFHLPAALSLTRRLFEDVWFICRRPRGSLDGRCLARVGVSLYTRVRVCSFSDPLNKHLVLQPSITQWKLGFIASLSSVFISACSLKCQADTGNTHIITRSLHHHHQHHRPVFALVPPAWWERGFVLLLAEGNKWRELGDDCYCIGAEKLFLRGLERREGE